MASSCDRSAPTMPRSSCSARSKRSTTLPNRRTEWAANCTVCGARMRWGRAPSMDASGRAEPRRVSDFVANLRVVGDDHRLLQSRQLPPEPFRDVVRRGTRLARRNLLEVVERHAPGREARRFRSTQPRREDAEQFDGLIGSS